MTFTTGRDGKHLLWKVLPIQQMNLCSRSQAIKYKLIHQQVEKAFTQDNRLYWTGSLVTANQPFNANWRATPKSIPPGIDPLSSPICSVRSPKHKPIRLIRLCPLSAQINFVIHHKIIRRRSEQNIYHFLIQFRSAYLILPETHSRCNQSVRQGKSNRSLLTHLSIFIGCHTSPARPGCGRLFSL